MPLSAGVRLGVYEVTALVGEGGMGQAAAAAAEMMKSFFLSK